MSDRDDVSSSFNPALNASSWAGCTEALRTVTIPAVEKMLENAEKNADYLKRLREAGLTEMLIINATICCDPRMQIDPTKRQAVIDKLNAVAKALKNGV